MTISLSMIQEAGFSVGDFLTILNLSISLFEMEQGRAPTQEEEREIIATIMQRKKEHNHAT